MESSVIHIYTQNQQDSETLTMVIRNHLKCIERGEVLISQPRADMVDCCAQRVYSTLQLHLNIDNLDQCIEWLDGELKNNQIEAKVEVFTPYLLVNKAKYFDPDDSSLTDAEKCSKKTIKSHVKDDETQLHDGCGTHCV